MINKRHIVSGLKSAHGLWRAGENGLLARHSGLLRTSETGQPGRADGPRRGCHALRAVARRQGARRWRSGVGGVAGSGWCSGVLVEGSSGRAVLRLEAEARGELRALRQSGKKSTAWRGEGESGWRRAATPF
jgi:hypothetical protein